MIFIGFNNSGAGGVGYMVVQLAKALDANVWATGRTADQSLISELGATPLDYTTASSDDIIAASPEGQGFNIVYDTVGGPVLDTSLSMTTHYGHITSCAAFGNHNLASSSLRCATVSGVFVLMPMLTGNRRSHHGDVLKIATRLVEEGKLRPLVDPRHFTLDQAIDPSHICSQHGRKLWHSIWCFTKTNFIINRVYTTSMNTYQNLPSLRVRYREFYTCKFMITPEISGVKIPINILWQKRWHLQPKIRVVVVMITKIF